MLMPTADEFNARSVHVPRFTERSASWCGRTPLSVLERLSSETLSSVSEAASDVFVEWSLEGSTSLIVGGAGAKEIWVRMQAAVTLPMQCQRCLGDVPLPLRLDRRFRFVSSEAQAATLDEQVEDYDVLVSSHQFDFQELLEDELLMALPMSTTHDTCPVQSEPPGLADDHSAVKPNAFAMLAGLRSKSM